jgi:hypothetical protein
MYKLFKNNFEAITGVIAFIFYVITLAPSTIQIDSGELAAVQALAGIAHPTGYPLFTIAGYLFSFLPFSASIIFQLNILSALWCTLAVVMFVKSVKLILDNIDRLNVVKVKVSPKQSRKKKQEINAKQSPSESEFIISEDKKIAAAVLSGLMLAFSRTFWFQSTSVEVYSLHIFLMSLIILFLIKGYLLAQSSPEKVHFTAWLIFAFILALGFTNHMTTLLILPGTAFLYFNKYRFTSVSFKRIGIMVALFAVMLIIFYAYLPIRASQNPVINWGNPVDFERLIRHISGKQYQVWLFSSAEASKKQLVYFINSLPSEFNISLFIGFIGLFASYVLARKMFFFLAITFFTTVLYSINYDINDIDAYFLLAYVTVAYFAAFGIIQILKFLKSKKYGYALPAGLIITFIAVQAYFNFIKVDQSKTFTFEDYTKAVLGSIEENAAIFSYQWDYFISQSYYFQFVENYRRDVKIIDKELLRRSWYYNQLETAHPGTSSGVQKDVELFLEALKPFERGENYDSNLLETLFRRIMTGLVKTNIEKGEYYIAPEIFENEMQRGEFSLPEGFTLVPHLLLFKVVDGNDYVPAPDPDFSIRFPQNRNRYVNFIESMVGSMLARRALYEMQFDRVDRAKIYITKIQNEFPNYSLPPGLIEVLSK